MTADSSDVTLATIYNILQEQGKRLDRIEAGQLDLSAGQQGISKGMVRQNGQIEFLSLREKKHSGKLEDHDGLIAKLMAAQAVANERDKHHNARIGEASEERKDLRAKVWTVTLKVAEIAAGGGVAAVVLKALEKMLEKAGG